MISFSRIVTALSTQAFSSTLWGAAMGIGLGGGIIQHVALRAIQCSVALLSELSPERFFQLQQRFSPHIQRIIIGGGNLMLDAALFYAVASAQKNPAAQTRCYGFALVNALAHVAIAQACAEEPIKGV